MLKILLLGGAGFLGVGLQEELSLRGASYKSIDKEELDLFDASNIMLLAKLLKDYDNVVILASKLGAKLFETDALNAANYNKAIHENVLLALKLASKTRSKPFSVTFYSTSEVFGSLPSINDYIDENTEYKFDFSNLRHLYAYAKWQAERDYFILQVLQPEVISSVKIIRPFNIYGRGLQRGVLFDMVRSALLNNVIYYADDTTRTMTDIDFASKISVDTILSDNNIKLNVADSRNSLTMKSLAKIVANVLNKDCKLVKLEPDKSIRYRTVSEIDKDVCLSERIMRPHIIQIAKYAAN